ncbi:MAG: T9SS type A sorting domain-containing protein [Chitinophagaceae bacterium]
MKRSVLFICFLLPVLLCNAAIITWDGEAGDSQWNTAANWVGDVVPGPADDVVLDNSSLAGPYFVALPAGAVSITVNTLTITPAAPATIILNLLISNTSSTAFTATGSGDAVILNSGAVFLNASGAGSGTPVQVTSAGFFRINNGAIYVHNTPRGHTTNLVDRLSTVAGTENGAFVFDIPAASYTVSLSGRTYGSLLFLTSASGGAITYIGSGSNPLTVKSDLVIAQGATVSISMSADFIVEGNYSQYGSNSTFNIQSSSNNNLVKIAGNIFCEGTITESGSGEPHIELNGTANQDIDISGTMTNSVTLNMNNAAGATLLNPLTLPYHLQLNNGKITTTATNLLTMSDGGQVTGGSTSSFVNGPMKKIGDDDFIFPLGTGSIYAPVGISGGTGATITDEFTAEYIRASPQSTFGTNYAGGINHISFVEYWTLDRGVATTASKNVLLDVHATSFCKQVANTFVSKWDGTQWTNEQSSAVLTGTTGAYELGTVTTIAPITSFSPFTLATDQDFITNPLPVHLTDLTVVKMNNHAAGIRWKLATPCSGAVTFTVERSADRNNYSAVQTITGNDTWLEYAVTDNQLPKGTSYYRLRTKDEAGKITYSKIAAVINDAEGLLLSAVLPNPVQGDARVTVTASKAGVVLLFLYDLSGKLVRQWRVPVSEGNNTVVVPSAMLSKGVYQLVGIQENNRSSIRFVKQ